MSVLLIDGRSGSGKTELATALVQRSPCAQLVRLDDLYPGWDGLEAGSRAVSSDVLGCLRWTGWDWQADAPAEQHRLDPGRPIVIEGCGALSSANRLLATLGLWVELDAQSRKLRALARDGENYAPHWDRWAAQEQRFIDREKPAELADAVVDGRDVLAGLDRLLVMLGI